MRNFALDFTIFVLDAVKLVNVTGVGRQLRISESKTNARSVLDYQLSYY